MITSLSATGLQGGDFTDTLAPVTIWTGDNASGKTKRLNAIQLAARAEHPDPKIGSSNAGIMQLASGPKLRVDMEYRGSVSGRVVRNWTTTKTGFSLDINTPLDAFPSLLLNPREYFGLSPAKQIELVAGMVKVDDPQFSVAGLTAAVKNIKLPNSANTPASEAAVSEVCNSLRSIPATAPLPWLEAALKLVKESLSTANGTKKRMVGVTTGLEQLRAQDTAAEAGTGTVERDLRMEREKLAGLQKDEGVLTGRVTAAARPRARREALEAVKAPEGVNESALVATRDELAAKIAKMTKAVQERMVSVADLSGTLASCQAKQGAAAQSITALNQRIERLESIQAPVFDGHAAGKELGRLQKLVADLESAIGRRKLPLRQMEKKVSDMIGLRAGQASAYTQFKTQIAAIHAEIKEFMAMKCCPTCLADGTEWKKKWHLTQLEKVKVLESKKESAAAEGTRINVERDKTAQLAATMRSEDEGLKVAQDELAAVNRSIADAFAAQKRYEADTQDLRLQKADRDAWKSQADFAAAKITEVKPFFDAYVAEDRELELLRCEHNNAVTLLQSAAAALNQHRAARTELAAITAPEAAESLAHEQQQLGAKVSAANERIGTLEGKQRGIIATRADLKRQMEAAAAATLTESEIAVLKSTDDLLREKQADVATLAFRPLLKIANRFASCLMDAPLEYRDNQLGYQDPATGTYVKSNTFNGALQSVCYMGFAAALSQGAKERPVLFDEMTRIIGRENKLKVVRRMLDLIQDGTITQFLGNDGDGDVYEDLGDKVKIISV